MICHVKAIEFPGSSQEDLCGMPVAVRRAPGVELLTVQCDGAPADWKPMPEVGADAMEIRDRDVSGASRVIHVARFADVVHVSHAFRKRTQETPEPGQEPDIDPAAKPTN
jgi:phage-related protein